MWRVSGVLAFAVAVSALAAIRGAAAADAQRMYAEAAAEGGELRYIQGIPVLLLEGEPEQMGRQQAALVLEVARRHSNLPKTILGQYGGGVLWPLVVGYSRSLMKDAPERYRRELNGACTKAKYQQEEIDALRVANSLIELRRFDLCSAFLVEPERMPAARCSSAATSTYRPMVASTGWCSSWSAARRSDMPLPR